MVLQVGVVGFTLNCTTKIYKKNIVVIVIFNSFWSKVSISRIPKAYWMLVGWWLWWWHIWPGSILLAILPAILLNQQYCQKYCQQYCWSATLPAILLNQQYCRGRGRAVIALNEHICSPCFQNCTQKAPYLFLHLSCFVHSNAICVCIFHSCPFYPYLVFFFFSCHFLSLIVPVFTMAQR